MLWPLHLLAPKQKRDKIEDRSAAVLWRQFFISRCVGGRFETARYKLYSTLLYRAINIVLHGSPTYLVSNAKYYSVQYLWFLHTHVWVFEAGWRPTTRGSCPFTWGWHLTQPVPCNVMSWTWSTRSKELLMLDKLIHCKILAALHETFASEFEKADKECIILILPVVRVMVARTYPFYILIAESPGKARCSKFSIMLIFHDKCTSIILCQICVILHAALPKRHC